MKPLGQGRFSVELTVDPQWLHDPERQFPVLLDPTITVPTSAEDASYAWLCGGCTPNTDYRMYLGTGYQDVWRGVLRFDTAALPVDTINSAELQLYHDGGCLWNAPSCSTTSRTLELYKMTSPWNLSTPVSQVAFDPAMVGQYTLPAGAANLWMKWDATQTVRSWITGSSASNGFLLKQSQEVMGVGGAVTPIGRRHWETNQKPRLVVNYTDLPVTLNRIETTHSNGAELSWTPFTSATGEAFAKYEVHRSENADFRPSSSTVVADVTDRNVTSFVDTTAAPNKSFTYRIVANGTHSSNARTVTLPADGQAVKYLQEEPQTAQDTYIYYDKNYEFCWGMGTRTELYVGSMSWARERPILRFDLAGIPAGATVHAAKLSLHQEGAWRPQTATKVNLHRVTKAWQQGGVDTGCNGRGANWYTIDQTNKWTTPGADFDPVIEASITTDPNAPIKRDDYQITSLVSRWVSGEAPNFGVLLKTETEPLVDYNQMNYHSTETSTLAPPELVRPTLEIRYADGSQSKGPSITLTKPLGGARMSGIAETLAATAVDDGRVEKVEFLVDGVVVSTDTAAPYSATWNSKTVANGTRTFAAKAYDEVGNVTTSAAVQAEVANSAAPTVSISGPASGATVSGTVPFNATATDDGTVTKVEFLSDGLKLGEDTTTPYSFSWDTLNPALPFYNGAHTLSAVAHDNHGQTTTTSIPVTVSNNPGTKYKATFGTTAVPQALMWQYNCGCVQQASGINVTVTNSSPVTWLQSDVVLKYRWIGTDGVVAVNGPDVPLGQDLAPGAQKTIRVDVPPPGLGNGVDRAQYVLRFDLYEKSTATWFTQKGNAPHDSSVTIHRAKATDQLGLEKFYQYEGLPVGAGMTHLVNAASGNSLLRWTPFSSPGRGLSTVLDLTYNSLEDKSESPAGNNFSLSISSLTRFGNPLDIHPNKADEIAGNPKRTIRFVDGDGTTHEFTGKQHTDGTVYWEEPAGVHLYLRKYSTTNLARTWALTRPDGVTFFYDDRGFPTSIEDRNGNKLTFTTEAIPSGEDPGGVKRRITAVTDPAGNTGSPNRTFNIDYYSKDEAKKPQIRGKIERITDHNGSALVFDYYEDGNLLRLTQKGGLKADGSPLADRSFVFTYTTSTGDGPAIATAAARVSPDPKTNQSTRLYSVRDPRGAETTFAYLGSGTGTDRWKLSSVTDRAGKATTYAYDGLTRITTVTAPLSRVTKYAFDAEGKVTKITNPKNEDTLVQWNADRHVTMVTEPTGKYTEFRYNDNGYLVEQWDQLRNKTTLTYQNLAAPAEGAAADPKDALAYWKTGRTIPHLSQLTSVADPNLNEHKWEYDARGNVLIVTDPESFKTVMTYDPVNGDLLTVRDPNWNYTTFSAYDANGFPTQVQDAKTQITKFTYDDDGLLRSLMKPRLLVNGAKPKWTVWTALYFDYDAFHRLGRRSEPKSSADVVWSGTDYDANDNPIAQLSPRYGVPGAVTGAAGPKVTNTYDSMDRLTLSDGPDDQKTAYVYDAAGRVTSVTAPKGVATPVADDYATLFTYDPLDRVLTESRHQVDAAGTKTQTRTSHYCYDTAGDLVSRTAPKANVPSVDCASITKPPYTTKLAYDAAHRLTTVTKPGNRTRSYTYWGTNDVKTVTNENNATKSFFYDRRRLLSKVTESFDGTRTLTTKYEHDAAGNVIRKITPKAWDASPDKVTFADFVTEYSYDAVNQLTKISLPWDSKGSDARHYVYREYDADGNMTMTSLPTTGTSAAEELKTTNTYYLNGWIRTTHDNVNPVVTYDYAAEGWQTSRSIPGTSPERWTYNPDGTLAAHADRKDQVVRYFYDENNNLKLAEEHAGKDDDADPKQDGTDLRITYNGFDEPIEVKKNVEGDTSDAGATFTTYAYDLNGNVTQRIDDGKKDAAGVVSGRKHTFEYDEADWLLTQWDRGDGSGCQDDQLVVNDYFPTGWQKSRSVKRPGSTCPSSTSDTLWQPKQVTEWQYHVNGDMKDLATRNGQGALLEHHQPKYTKVDSFGRDLYFNGHRVEDYFKLSGPGSSCTSYCTTKYGYDARDRLVHQHRSWRPLADREWKLDPAGNTLLEKGGGGPETSYSYRGTQLQTSTVNGVTTKYLYNPTGTLACVVKSGYTGAECPQASSGNVYTQYTYDYLDRLKNIEQLGGDATVDASTKYTHDVLDRLVREKESRGTRTKQTDFTYVGVTSNVAKERIDNSDTVDSVTDVTKTYSYDAFGTRISMTNSPDASVITAEGGKADTYTYSYDVHGSVSMLVGSGGNVEASYGYQPYGKEDGSLSSGELDGINQLNPYRYSGRRFDTGSDTIDMGARRFAPNTARFLQPDSYQGALSNLGLSTDPLTGNRYALAAGNPVSFIEVDGHKVAAIGPRLGDDRGEVTDGWAVAGGAGDGDSTSPAKDLSEEGRTQAMATVFDHFPGDSNARWGHGQGIMDFIAWMNGSGRLDPQTGSPWWRSVNGAMVADAWQALAKADKWGVYANSSDPVVQKWLDYFKATEKDAGAKRENALLWEAHQASLHRGIRQSSVLRLLEPEREQKFIDIVVANVDWTALQRAPMGNPGVKLWTSSIYADTYPISESDYQHALSNQIPCGPLCGVTGINSTLW